MYNTRVIIKDTAVFIRGQSPALGVRILVLLCLVLTPVMAHKSLVWAFSFVGTFSFFTLLLLFTPYDCMIDGSGIKAKSMLKERTLEWASVRDYGIAYLFRGRYGARFYRLYFADSVLPELSRERKSFLGLYTVIINIDERAVLRKGADIMAFCAQFTDVKPFVADPDNHTGFF